MAKPTRTPDDAALGRNVLAPEQMSRHGVTVPMKNFLAAALCLCAATTSLRAQADLDKLVPQLLKDGDVPGLSMALVNNGAVSWHHSWGVKDASTGAPIDDETIFEAASLSKPVFAYAVMKLVDAGVIDLDTPIAHYLPGDYVRDPRGAPELAQR